MRLRILLASSSACELADVSNFDEDLDACIGKPRESDPTWQSLETSGGRIANNYAAIDLISRSDASPTWPGPSLPPKSSPERSKSADFARRVSRSRSPAWPSRSRRPG